MNESSLHIHSQIRDQVLLLVHRSPFMSNCEHYHLYDGCLDQIEASLDRQIDADIGERIHERFNGEFYEQIYAQVFAPVMDQVIEETGADEHE